MDRVPVVDLLHDGGEVSRPVLIEKLEHSRDDASDVMTTLGRPLHKELGGGDGHLETSLTVKASGGSLLGEQGLDVFLVLDAPLVVEGAPVLGDDFMTIVDPNDGVVGPNGQLLPYVLVRDRIVVSVEADIGCLADADIDSIVGWKSIVG